ncbi:alpha/beta hydrolase [Gymnodinialimonas ceratoperidinii]|uniref:Dienelactone hydrolase family protein n=1 Tax=Gymnodinialimonas ceratoperidinii TaxID=2856823 RepID=A0A8F6TUK8_9RHOB|nr:dienelactone hydrolase family protein [Gymnodinialimonas ceratoperidinii]QXT38144.1 dienelactone hydrolase family protein [Gymnodinialimonas ceratoperidinii]
MSAGAPLARASAVAVMLHGRGGQPDDMIGLAEHLGLPDLAVVAPAAAGHSWWPDSFLAPLEANEPGLSSGLSVVEALLEALSAESVAADRVVLAGFSQGACLALEAAARLARPFRAVAALSGGLVGTDDTTEPGSEALYGHRPKRFDYEGRLDGVPILIGCHERDPHIPLARVRESAHVLQEMGAEVDTIIIPGAGHGIIEQEAAWLRKHLNSDA